MSIWTDLRDSAGSSIARGIATSIDGVFGGGEPVSDTQFPERFPPTATDGKLPAINQSLKAPLSTSQIVLYGVGGLVALVVVVRLVKD